MEDLGYYMMTKCVLLGLFTGFIILRRIIKTHIGYIVLCEHKINIRMYRSISGDIKIQYFLVLLNLLMNETQCECLLLTT